MPRNTQEVFEYLKQELGSEPRVSLRVRHYADYDSIDITPSAKAIGDRYAAVTLGIHDKYDLTVDIGKGNHFDMPFVKGDEAYVLDIVKACIEGKVEETITERGNEIVRSKLRIDLSQGRRTFNYRKGLFGFGGNKRHIGYEPYPH
jgi:hypothetical protein